VSEPLKAPVSAALFHAFTCPQGVAAPWPADLKFAPANPLPGPYRAALPRRTAGGALAQELLAAL